MSLALGADQSRHRSRVEFSELLRVEGRLALREPYFLMGLAFPIALLVLFWLIGVEVPGQVAGSGLTILELWIPTILVISYLALAMIGMPASFARDREIGWLRRVSTTPVPPYMLLAAQLVLNVIIAAVATVVVVFAGAILFGASLQVGIEFVGVVILAIAEMFSLGLVVTAIAPSQRGATYITGALFYPLLFLSGLWVQPVQVGGALQTIMYYSPVGAAVRALLWAEFNAVPPASSIVAMLVYTAVFALVAIRYFRWE